MAFDRKEYIRRHYRDNRAYYIAKARSARQRITDYIRSLKAGPCTDCLERYPYYVMDFDHVGEKSYEPNRLSQYGSMALVKRELAKCELVCSNCHRIRSHRRAEEARKRLKKVTTGLTH